MKIITQIGSKDRFIEMFERVNKIQLNEEIVQNNNSNSVLENTFQELKNNQLNIQHVNNQANGDESFVEIIGIDKGGNYVNLKFKVTSSQSEQDGVFNVDSVQLDSFTFNTKNGGQTIEMDVNALKQFNAQHSQELVDIVSEYVDVESEQPEVDELYEEAIKKIDSYNIKEMSTFRNINNINPEIQKIVAVHLWDGGTGTKVAVFLRGTKKDTGEEAWRLYPKKPTIFVKDDFLQRPDVAYLQGKAADEFLRSNGYKVKQDNKTLTKLEEMDINPTIGMQTLSAYADEKPTNPEVRVNSPELEKYVSEIQEYNPEEEQPEGDVLDLPPDYSNTDISTDDEPEIVNPDNIKPSEPEEPISPEKEKIIMQAYDNLIARGISAPTVNQILAEIDKINPSASEKPDPESHMAVGKKRVYPSMAEPFLENLDATDILSRTYEKQLSPEKKEEFINFVKKYVDMKLGAKKNQISKEDYIKIVKAVSLEIYNRGLAELNETDYPEEMGIPREIKTTTNYPKPKKKHKTKKLKIKTGVSESIDQDKYEEVVFLQGDEAYQPLEILNTKGKDAALEYLKQWHYPGEHQGSQELGHGTEDQTYEKDGYIMSWNSGIGYIGLQYDLSKMNEDDEQMSHQPFDNEKENPEETPELNANGNEEIEKLAKDKEEQGEVLIGGKGDGKSPLEFDADQVIKGLEVEKEHTDDPLVAIEVVLDHLSETPDYYTVKDTPQDSAQAEAAKDAEGENIPEENNDDEEMTDILLGYEPKNVGDDTEDNKEIPAIKEDIESDLKQKDPATWHQIQIAKKTIKMPGAMADIMGGMTKEEAREILTKRGIKVEENIVGASGVQSVVGSNNNTNGAQSTIGSNSNVNTKDNDSLKKYQEYEKEDINSLNDGEKKEYFELWTKFKNS